MKWKILMSLLKIGAHKVLARSCFYTKGKWIVTMLLGHDSDGIRGPWLTQGMFCIVWAAKVLKRLVWPKLLPKRCFGHNKLPCCLKTPKEVFLLEIGEFQCFSNSGCWFSTSGSVVWLKTFKLRSLRSNETLVSVL